MTTKGGGRHEAAGRVGGGSDATEGLGGFKWLNACQFGGALNDNFLKLAIIYALSAWWVGKDQKEILGLVGIVFSLPFLLFLGLGGNLADRFSRSSVVQWSKFLEIGVAAGALVSFICQSPAGLLASAFLMSTQSAIFSPSKYGIIPELVGSGGIARANGFLQGATYLAIIGGTLLAPALSSVTARNYSFLALFSLMVAVAGWILSLGIPRTRPGVGDRTAGSLVIPDLRGALKCIHSDGFLAMAVWGSALFGFVAGFAQLNLLSYGTEHLLLPSHESSTILFLFIALGIGMGSMVAGGLSRRSIEFGVVPIGAMLLSACSLLLGLDGKGEFIHAATLCLGMGFGAGLFIVPIESFVQYRTPPNRRGEVIAAAGWLSWVGVLLASATVYVLPKVGLGAASGFVILGAMVAVLFAFAMWKLPDFLVRFFAMILTRAHYRLRVAGQENVPGHGAALIVANHSSLMDAACLLAAQPRRIRFLMDRDYIRNSSPGMRLLFGLMKVIPVSQKGTPREIIRSLKEAREALSGGWLVGIFPEGALTRTGHMLEFKRGYQKIVRGSGADIIPAYIDGLFGTRASYAFENPVPFSARDFRRTVGIVFGEAVGDEVDPSDLQDAVRTLADRASILRGWDAGSVGTQLIRTCRANWGRSAISDSSGKRLSYGELLCSVVAMLPRLGGAGTRRGDIVGVLLPPSVAGVLVNLCLTIGRRVSANLNYTSSAEAIKSAIRIADIRTVVTSRAFLEKTGIELDGVEAIFVEDMSNGVGAAEKAEAFLRAKFLPVELLASGEGWHPDEMLTVLFSSGSTAAPKAIALSHRNISSNIDAFASVARVQEGDCLLGVLPFFHSMGYTTTLIFPLLKGIEARYHHHPLECEHIDRLCRDGKVTIVIGTPTFMLAWARKIRPESLGNLRWAVAGAEKMRPKVAGVFQKKFGVRPMEGYGATECSPVVSVNVPDADFGGLRQIGSKEGSAGRPLPNVVCRVVDPESRVNLPRGRAGLLLVKAPSVMLGYLGGGSGTEDGWYATGDIAVLDGDGFLSITDRLSRFSKIGGEMVSHTAVEELIRQAAGGSLAGDGAGPVVSSRPDDKKGERLVVIYETGKCDLGAAQEAVSRADFPNLWKPSRQDWVGVPKIPVLETGKLDLRAIRAAAAGEAGAEGSGERGG